MGIYGFLEHCLSRLGPRRTVSAGMPVMFKYFPVLLGWRDFIARNVQRHPITIKITVDVAVALCAHDTQISLAWIDWEQTTGF
jgi:hypothetical protein